jgi:hypothetical protein
MPRWRGRWSACTCTALPPALCIRPCQQALRGESLSTLLCWVTIATAAAAERILVARLDFALAADPFTAPVTGGQPARPTHRVLAIDATHRYIVVRCSVVSAALTDQTHVCIAVFANRMATCNGVLRAGHAEAPTALTALVHRLVVVAQHETEAKFESGSSTYHS